MSEYIFDNTQFERIFVLLLISHAIRSLCHSFGVFVGRCCVERMDSKEMYIVLLHLLEVEICLTEWRHVVYKETTTSQHPLDIVVISPCS